MSKSILTIQKEILKKEHEKTPLGQLEKQIRQFYNSSPNLDKETIEKINKIRGDNEQAQLDYIEKTNKEHKEYIDNSLFEAMTKELEIINNFKSTHDINE